MLIEEKLQPYMDYLFGVHSTQYIPSIQNLTITEKTLLVMEVIEKLEEKIPNLDGEYVFNLFRQSYLDMPELSEWFGHR